MARPTSVGLADYRDQVVCFGAVVLAGGAAHRMGGADKPAVRVGGRTMLDRVLSAAAEASPRVVVGPACELPADVRLTREQPAGGGPVAATGAGLDCLAAAAAHEMPEFVVLLAADLPLLTVTAVRSLVGRLAENTGTSRAGADDARADHVQAGQVEAGHARGGDRGGAGHLDGVVYLDDQGRRQPLCGAWRTATLGAAVDRLRLSRGGTLAGASMRALLAELNVAELPWTGTGAPPWFDCDTGDDVRRAEEWTR